MAKDTCQRRILLCADAVLPMTSGNPVIRDGAVLVCGDIIESVGSKEQLLEQGTGCPCSGLRKGSTDAWPY